MIQHFILHGIFVMFDKMLDRFNKAFIFWCLYCQLFTAGVVGVFVCVCVCVSVCVCVCVYVFTSIHREGIIFLGLEFQDTDQRCCIEEVSFLCLHRNISMKHRAFLTSRFILFIH